MTGKAPCKRSDPRPESPGGGALVMDIYQEIMF